MATTDMEGHFEIKTGTTKGVIAGRSVVTISLKDGSGSSLANKTMTPEEMQAMAMSGELQKEMDKQSASSLIPERYGKADASGLSAEIKAGETNEFTFALK